VENQFLLTYSVPVPYEGVSKVNLYKWFSSEEEMGGFCDAMKETYGNGFVIEESIEIVDSRQVEI